MDHKSFVFWADIDADQFCSKVSRIMLVGLWQMNTMRCVSKLRTYLSCGRLAPAQPSSLRRSSFSWSYSFLSLEYSSSATFRSASSSTTKCSKAWNFCAWRTRNARCDSLFWALCLYITVRLFSGNVLWLVSVLFKARHTYGCFHCRDPSFIGFFLRYWSLIAAIRGERIILLGLGQIVRLLIKAAGTFLWGTLEQARWNPR